MAFKNNSVHVEKKETEQEKKTLERLSFLGTKVEEAHGELKKYEDIKKHVEDAKNEASILDNEIAVKRQTLTVLKDEVDTLEKTRKQILEVKEDIRSLGHKKDIANEELRLLEIETNNKRISALEIQQKLNNDNAQIERSIETKRQELNALDKDSDSLVTKVSDLTLSVKMKETEISSALAELKTITEAIEHKKKLYADTIVTHEQVKADLEQTKNTIHTLKKDMDARIEKEEQIILTKKATLDQREGELSLKESWLTGKAKHLKEIKNNLEAHFNKKINIIFD